MLGSESHPTRHGSRIRGVFVPRRKGQSKPVHTKRSHLASRTLSLSVLFSSSAAHRLGTDENAVDEPDSIVSVTDRTQNKVDRNGIPRRQTRLQPSRKETFLPVEGILALLYRLRFGSGSDSKKSRTKEDRRWMDKILFFKVSY